MTPEQILAAMAQAYERCATYRDSGHVATLFLNPDGTLSHTSLQPFRTAFVRPDRYRFEYNDEGSRCIIWADGQDVLRWWDVDPGVKRPESLGLALAGATGVSGGSAHTVPALLMPEEVGGRLLTDLADLVLLGEGQIGGAACYRIRAQHIPEPPNPEREEYIVQLTGRPMQRA